MYGNDYDYGFNGYGDDTYYSVNEVIEDMESHACVPTVMEIVTVQDEKTGNFKEEKVYNCSNCVNYDCPYFYEIDGLTTVD